MLLYSVLQKLKGSDSPAGYQSAGLQCCLQREANKKERTQAENNPTGWRGHCPGTAEQRAGRTMAEGEGQWSLAHMDEKLNQCLVCYTLVSSSSGYSGN